MSASAAPIDDEQLNGKTVHNNASFQLSEEQFTKLLGATNSSNVFQNFADPGPLGFISFILCLTPTVACLTFWGSLSPLSMVGLV